MPQREVTCELCLEPAVGSVRNVINIGNVCEECFSEEGFHCSDCGEPHIFNEGCLSTQDGDTVCEYCADEYITCDNCSEVVHVDRSESQDGITYCEGCFADLSYVCSGCDDSYHGEAFIIEGEAYCRECAIDAVSDILDEVSDCSTPQTCGGCQDRWRDIANYIPVLRIHGTTGWPVLCLCGNQMYSMPRNNPRFTANQILSRSSISCEACIANGGAPFRRVHSYSYKPDPEFRSTSSDLVSRALHFGTEVEVELLNEDMKTDALALMDELDKEKLFYCKSDSTIDDGFEIVSHPFTYNWMNQNREAFNAVFKLGNMMEGWAAKNCGMHVHMSIDAFTDLHLFKFMRFFSLNKEFIQRVSRRELKDLERWANIETPEKKKVLRFALTKRGSPFGRAALNFGTREKTVECRIFRSTLAPTGYYGNVEFLQSLYDYTKNCGAGDDHMSLDSFMRFVNDRGRAYPNFVTMTNIIAPSIDDQFDWGNA